MTARIFIDGEAGTTGLQIRARLEARRDIELLRIADDLRKNEAERARLLNTCDIAILCLPDAAAHEAVRLVENPEVRAIDASSAHRTDPDWVYGLPEMAPDQEARIRAAKRVSNPGCYPTGVICSLRPLITAGLMPADYPVTVHAVSGYSGGGRQLIEQYEAAAAPARITSPIRLYGLGLEHKHTEEMRVHALLARRPVFVPSVGRFRQGMLGMVGLQLWALPGAPSPQDIHAALAEAYRDSEFIEVPALAASASLAHLDPEGLNDTNRLCLHVFGNAEREQVLLVSLYDNLGKGASGAAVQNLNVMLGVAPQTGLTARQAA